MFATLILCYIGFWVLMFIYLIVVSYWEIFLVLLLLIIFYIIFQLCIKKAERTERRNNSMRQSIWFYCRYNGLKDVSCDDERMLLDELACNNKFGVSKVSFKNYVYDVVCDDELYEQLDKGFINHSRIKATHIYHKCKELRIRNGNIEGNDRKWNVISESFDVPVNVAKELYVRQCDEYKNQRDEKKEQNRIILEEKKKQKELLAEEKFNKRKALEDKLFFDELDISKNTGKARYTYSDINVYSKLIDLSDVVSKSKLLNIEVCDYEITEFRNIIVPVSFSYKKDIKLFGKPAVLDGSFCIKVLDKSNNLVAEGIVNGLVTKKKIYGFENLNRGVLCKCDDKKLIDGKKSYIVEVIPINLWILEL